MADYTIAADEVGVYEIELTAGQKVTVALDATSRGTMTQVLVHSATKLVYARNGDSVAVKDSRSTVVPAGTWYDFSNINGQSASLSLITSGTATVSVTRR